VGNLISDFVKGKKQFDYPDEIRNGIILHRSIDTFTDTHEATKQAKEIFRPYYRLYSGAFIDVVYDHFLATDENEFPGNSLFDFSQWVYTTLDNYPQWFPSNFAAMLPYMKMHNWLYNYRTRGGIEKSLNGVVRRAAYLTEGDTAFRLFELHYQPLSQCFRQFWKDLKPFAKEQFTKITTGNVI
jgi:acyl carrier protein phosphodiesterase